MYFDTAILLLVLVHFNIILEHSSVTAQSKYFTAVTDQKEVDEEAHLFAEYKKTKRGRAVSILLRNGENICTVQWQSKIRFCEEIFRPFFYELKFNLNPRPNLNCADVTSWITILSKKESHHITLSMFSCPQIFYTDLKTNQPTPVPFTYTVSRARQHQFAILLVQKQPDPKAPIYPVQFFKNIDFKKLKSLETEETHEAIIYDSDADKSSSENMEDEIIAYLKAKRTTSMYLKFKLLFFSTNVCGRRQSHKVYFCRHGVSRYFGDVAQDTLGYDENNCKKYRIPITYQDDGGHIVRDNKLFLIHCPPSKNTYIPTETRFITLYYLASNLTRDSATLYVRKNLKNEKLQQKSNITKLNTRPVLLDIRREKFMPFPLLFGDRNLISLITPEEVEMQINSLKEDVRMPSTIAKDTDPTVFKKNFNAKSPSQVTQNRWLTDNFVVALSKIKSIKLVYQRFRQTYWSLDVCGLSFVQKVELCNDLLKDFKHRSIPKSADLNRFNRPCIQKMITLTTQGAENLKTNIISMWKCQTSQNDADYVYFVGKCHLRDAAIIYKPLSPIYSQVFVYPYAMATSISRYFLDEVL